KNATKEMRVGDDYFDHAMNIIISGTLNDLKVHDAITFNWPNKLAKPLVIETKLGIKNQSDILWDLTLFNISNQLATTGEWSINHPNVLTANLDLYMSDLKDIYPELTGVVKGDFSFSGDFKKPLLSGDLQGDNIKGFGLILDNLSLTANHNEAQTTALEMDMDNLQIQDIIVKTGRIRLAAEKIQSFDLSVAIKDIVNKETTLVDEVSLTSIGSLENHDINLKVRSIFNTTDFEGIGHVNRDNFKEWSLDINKFDVYSDVIGRYNLSKPAQLDVSADNIKLSLLCLQELPTTMCMEGQKTDTQSFGSLVIRRLQPKRLQSLLPPEIDINTTSDVVIVGQFTDENNFDGVVDLSLSEGHVRYRMQGYELNVPLKKTKAIIHAKPKEVMTQLDVDWGQYLQIHGGGTMKDPLGQQLVDLNIEGHAPTLNWILPIVPALQKLDGKLDMKFETSGQLAKGLDVGFNLNLKNGEIYNAEYNSLINNINLNIALKKGQTLLSVDGGMLAGSGKMALNGAIDLKTMESKIKVRGDSLLLANSDNVKALATPNFDIDLKKNGAVIKGYLLIPELNFLYKSSDDPRGSVQKVSEDTIVISSKRAPIEKKEPSQFWNGSTVDFKIVLGDNVSVGAVGFVGKLTGGLELKKSINSSLTALGIINMGSGMYNVLGQELTLDKGKIQFTGLDIANPNIEFQASRMFENKRTGTKVSVGVRVTGTAQNPKLNLFSQPGMPTNSIVSYLALGADVDSLTAVEMLQIAKMAQRIATGDIVSSNDNVIAKSVGLTDLGVMKDLSGNTSLGIGKYLTDDFYVGIGMSIFEENNSAFALMRYNFLKYFSFDTQVSDEYSTVDLRFSKEI
ncbi:translocation/assembly module TamB domain-containing protein, partial [Wohlfahrtiimonas larvae]